MKIGALGPLVVFLASAALAAAQDSAPAPTPSPAASRAPAPDAADVIMAPRSNDFVAQPPTDSDGETRSVSPGLAAALSAGMPKFSPPTPTPTPPAEDMRDIDKPKNEIKRLPKYVVQESRPPVFRERDLFTSSGLVDLSFRSHPGLNFGNILGLNSGPAMQMFLDDERLRNMADLDDTAHAIAQGGDATEGKYILQATQETYMRSDDDLSFGGPVGGANPGGSGR